MGKLEWRESGRFLCRKGDVGRKYAFQAKNIHMYTKEARVREGMEVGSIIYLILIKGDMLQHVHDAETRRRLGGAITDPFVVLWKVNLVKKEEGDEWNWKNQENEGARRNILS